MLRDKDPTGNIVVKDLKTTKKFYEGTFTLTKPRTEDQELIIFESGSSTVNIYQSQYTGTSQAASLKWVIREGIDGIIQRLKAKGSCFRITRGRSFKMRAETYFLFHRGNTLSLSSSSTNTSIAYARRTGYCKIP